MKLTFFIFALLSCTSTIAQTITLPNYIEGQYENDIVYTYYGSLPFTGMGRVDLGGSITSAFITGVHFKVVVDSTQQGASPTHAAYRDSLGTLVPVYHGDTLDIPAIFQLYAGDIGFHIIIEGTPQIAGESYLCDLGYTFSTGSDWEILILDNTQDSCIVDQFNGLNDKTRNQNIEVFPNPFNQSTTIEIKNYSNEFYNCIVYDFLGEKVKSINNIRSNKFMIDKEGLQMGSYIFQLQNKYGIIATGQLIIE